MVALIFCGDLKYCPYIKRYIERLEFYNSEYIVLFWNRSGLSESFGKNYYSYDSYSDLSSNKINKALDFIKFRKWLLKKLKELKPDKIIALSTLTGVFLGRSLYKGKIPYVFDIRDYSYEHIYPFYQIEKNVIKHSEFTAISSKGYKAFLPESDYVIAHNFNRNDISENCIFHKEDRDQKIRFVWNGVIRYFDFQKQYLDALKNDIRYEIVFHGDGPQLAQFREYCEVNGFNNVIFSGAYDNSKKRELLEKAHILNNCYGYCTNAGNRLKYAVSNRFYDGIIYRIPQIVEPVGYKSDLVKSNIIGENFEPDNSFADRVYDYYMNIDEKTFNQKCESLLKDIIAEDDIYISSIDSFILQ